MEPTKEQIMQTFEAMEPGFRDVVLVDVFETFTPGEEPTPIEAIGVLVDQAIAEGRARQVMRTAIWCLRLQRAIGI